MTRERREFILGGQKSGKSRRAEILASAWLSASPHHRALLIATAQPWDDEMRDRIGHHRDRRGEGWTTIEEPLDLVGVLSREARADRPVLVDCLTLWVTNLMLGERAIEAEFEALLAVLPRLSGPVVFVSNEVGLGIVPENAMAREFRDHAGRLRVAEARGSGAGGIQRHSGLLVDSAVAERFAVLQNRRLAGEAVNRIIGRGAF